MVDSIHCCAKGCNEVVMLRRLSLEEKIKALMILHGDEVDTGPAENDLNSSPHGRERVSSPVPVLSTTLYHPYHPHLFIIFR